MMSLETIAIISALSVIFFIGILRLYLLYDDWKEEDSMKDDIRELLK